MIFTPLASSSHGNAYLLEDGHSKLLIECGVSYKKLQQLMGFGTAALTACLVSHEHRDHAGCHDQLMKNGVPVYASQGTAEALDCEGMELLEDRQAVVIGSFTVVPFPTFHDAAQPMGFLICSQVDGQRLVFATDTVNLGYQFPNVNLVAIECNYDEAILALAQRMPEKVRHRVANSHMSVKRACVWLEKLDMSGVRTVYLMHLSDACSDEWHFRRLVEEVCPKGVGVVVCPKELQK